VSNFLVENESALRLTVFLVMLVGMALWELASPRRRVEIPRLIRWTNNLALVALDTAILRIAFPVLAVGVAATAVDRGWGLFNMIQAPSGLALIVSFLLLDLAIYTQHVVFQPAQMTPGELYQGFRQAYKQTFTSRTLLYRTLSSPHPLISFLGNTAYRLYVRRLWTDELTAANKPFLAPSAQSAHVQPLAATRSCLHAGEDPP